MSKKDGAKRARAYQKQATEVEKWYQQQLAAEKALEDEQRSEWRKRQAAKKELEAAGKRNPWPRRIVGLVFGGLLVLLGVLINFDPTLISHRIYGWTIDYSESTLKVFKVGGGIMGFIGLALMLISWKPDKRRKAERKAQKKEEARQKAQQNEEARQKAQQNS